MKIKRFNESNDWTEERLRSLIYDTDGQNCLISLIQDKNLKNILELFIRWFGYKRKYTVDEFFFTKENDLRICAYDNEDHNGLEIVIERNPNKYANNDKLNFNVFFGFLNNPELYINIEKYNL